MKEILERTIEGLKRRGFEAVGVATKAEALKLVMDEAEGKAKEILLVAEAQAAGITKVAEALNGKGGIESVNMQLAQQYLTQFGNLAKQNNSMIVPADLSNVAGILQACTSIIKKS